VEQNKQDIVCLLLPKQRIAPEPELGGPQMVLQAAIWHPRTEVFEKLLQGLQEDVNHQDDGGYTMPMRTAAYKRGSIVEVLLRATDVNVDLKDNEGCSALSIAAKKCSRFIVGILLEQSNPDINSRDLDGATPVMHAAIRNAVAVLIVC
jgi:ankyrin repeat protein